MHRKWLLQMLLLLVGVVVQRGRLVGTLDQLLLPVMARMVVRMLLLLNTIPVLQLHLHGIVIDRRRLVLHLRRNRRLSRRRLLWMVAQTSVRLIVHRMVHGHDVVHANVAAHSYTAYHSTHHL